MRLRRFLAVAVLLAAACGDDDAGTEATDPIETTAPSDDAARPTTTVSVPPPPVPPGDAVAVTADIPTRIPAGPHSWQFQVTNVTDAPVVLTFPTAQRGEAVIERDDGTVVHRWSSGRFFTQQVQEVPLAPGQAETVELADDLSAVEPGFYRVLLEPAITTEVAPISRSIRIVAPGT